MSSVEKPTHSSYESYSQTAKAYDITRVPVGLTILIERFGASGLALAHQHVLDVGCGTGNYLHALKDTVGSLVGLDGSQEMLLRAAQKCAGCSNIELKHGSILELPFQDQSFDGAMINQALHHLSLSSDLQQYRECLAEVFRVLKSGGVLCINTCSQEQLKPEGPFWKEWRDGDSAFAVYRDQGEMLATRLGELKRKILDRSISETVAESERVREAIGQYVMISARRP